MLSHAAAGNGQDSNRLLRQVVGADYGAHIVVRRVVTASILYSVVSPGRVSVKNIG